MEAKHQFLNAWSVQRYGGPEVLTPVVRPIPTPGPKDVLIRIRASAVSRADGMMRAGTPRFARLFLGLKRPRHDLVGTCLSGEIIATGNAVSRFSVGDQVYGMSGLNFGANASHICIDKDGVLMHKPDFLSHEEAAAMSDGPSTSLNFLSEVAELRADEKILVLGASGSLGTAAVQIAAAMGAEVSGTCSERNTGLVSSLGAKHVIDYNKVDITELSQKFDVIYDTLGVSSFRQSKKILTRNGRYVCPVLSFRLLVNILHSSLLGKRKARFSATGMLKPEAHRAFQSQLIDLIEADRFAPVMDRTYPFEQLVEAHRYTQAGHKRGNVVVV